MRPKFFLWLLESVLALGLVMWGGSAVLSYIAPLAVVDARLMETPPTPAPIPKPAVQVGPRARDKPQQAFLNLSVQGVDHGVLRITNRNKETYHGLLLRLIVGADFTSWTEVLRDIAPGETIAVRLRDITNDMGERFDPAWWPYRPVGRSSAGGPFVVIEGTLADGTKATAHW